MEKTYGPLDVVEIPGVFGEWWVTDALGRRYQKGVGEGLVQFVVGGACGWHTLTYRPNLEDKSEAVHFRVQAQTQLTDDTGEFNSLLQALFFTLVAEGDSADSWERKWVRYKGRLYFCLIPWLRDHVHVLKAMKYFTPRLKDGIDLYHDSQREDGMVWDNWHPKKPAVSIPDHWGQRFAYGDFARDFPDHRNVFTRIPVENDVEYLFVEGLYFTWKATGDDAWMAASLDAACRALEYTRKSPYRWSEKFGLLKRGHTIDTWDFQSDMDCLSEFAGWPDPMAVHPDWTEMGVFFGDNTGYAQSCEFLATMLEAAGRSSEGAAYTQRARDLRERLDALSWGGAFYTHHVPENPDLVRDLGVDETTQLSLSNAYSANRGIDPLKVKAIIESYQDLKDRLPEGSPGEWYTIYPPFPKGYGGHNDLWQYMNGSVTPIVAGELACAAFHYGFETYGVDILSRVSRLVDEHGGLLHSSYTGAVQAVQESDFVALELGPPAALAPHCLQDAQVPEGQTSLLGIPFVLPDAQRGLVVAQGETRSIPVGETATAIYVLHTLASSHPGRLAGTIRLEFEDSSVYEQVVLEGLNILPCSHWDRPKDPSADARVAWRGFQASRFHVQFVAYLLPNPFPDRVLKRVSFVGGQDQASWQILGLTLGKTEASFHPGPISFGIPNGWSAAAVTYALIEGLAGVVDTATTFRTATIAPRWSATETSSALVVVHYPASDGYVAYRWTKSHDEIKLLVTGSGESVELKVLLPKDTSAGEVLLGNRRADFSEELVEASTYVVLGAPLPGPIEITIKLLSLQRGNHVRHR